jgi:hypothetical protein
MFDLALLLLVAAIVFAPIPDAFMRATAWLIGAFSRRDHERSSELHEIRAH